MSYTEGFKARMIKRMTGPEGITASALAKEVGVGQPTLSRWVRERRLGAMSEKPKKRRTWTPADKLRLVLEASKLSDEDLGALLRREGLHQAQLDEWIEQANAAVLAGFSPPKRSSRTKSPEKKRIEALERELRRKDKALAEVTALLVLKKKLEAYYGVEADDTDTRSET